MSTPAEVRVQRRRADRSAIAGVLLMAASLLLSAGNLAPPELTTVGGLAGLALLMYAVHVCWMLFYDREDDGPPV